MFLDTVIQFNRKIASQVRDSILLMPALTRRPKVLRHWLFSAYKAQIIIVALLILLPFVVLPGLDTLLSKIFTPVSKKIIFGLIHTKEENPYLYGIQVTFHWILWISTVLLAVYLYLRHVPVSIEKAKKIAHEKVQQADQLINSNPSESILLYNAAREWSCDENTDSQLQSKIQDLNARLNQVNAVSSAPFVSPAEGTVIMSADEQQDEESNAIIADRYQVKKQLGAGAMGIVYQAEDLKLNRDVALKQLAPSLASDERLLARFRQEALALARLSHANIVQVYDFVEWNNLFFIVMEFIEGEELETKLGHAKPLKLQTAIRAVMQMADALGYAHERGVVHRDFKPANILVSNDGKIKITDFGIAKLAQSSLHTQHNTIMGSPAYMSPEQASGEPTDQRTDIYALGIVFYQLLSGQRPFEGDMKSIVAQHLTKTPADLNSLKSDIPSELNDIVQKMLAKEPAARYKSMAEVKEQLKNISA